MTTEPIDGYVTAPTTGLDVHVRDWGGPSPREGGQSPIVMVHGLASSCHIFDLCAPILALARRVVTYDQRGHGETAKPEDGYDTATFVADGVGLADALGVETPYVVAGHSWGATVGLHWTVRHPDLVHAVVLVDGAIFPFREAPGATWEELSERLTPPDLSSLTFEDLLERTRGSMGFLDETFRRSYFGALMNVSPDGSIRARLSRDKHLRILRTLWDDDVDAAIDALRRPALALLAERAPTDAAGRQMAEPRRRMVERLGTAQPLLHVRWLPDTIHDVPLQRPGLLAELVTDFVSTAGTPS